MLSLSIVIIVVVYSGRLCVFRMTRKCLVCKCVRISYSLLLLRFLYSYHSTIDTCAMALNMQEWNGMRLRTFKCPLAGRRALNEIGMTVLSIRGGGVGRWNGMRPCTLKCCMSSWEGP